MTKQEKLKHCHGCRNDFYNDRNDIGIKQCWSLKDMKLVTRYKIGTWTQPTQPGAFTKVTVPQCYHRSGEHYYENVPSFVKTEDIR